MKQTSTLAWEALGLSPDDRQAYLAVLRGAADEDAVAIETGQSPAAVAVAFDRLRDRGLIGSGADGAVVAGQPLLTLRRAAAHLQGLAGDLLDDSADLQLLHDRTNIPDRHRPDVRVLTSLPQVQRAFADLLASAEEEVLACVKPPFLATGDFTDDEHFQLDRGVSFRVVYDPEAMADVGGLDELAALVRAGEQARVTDAIPLKMFLVDGRRALLPMTDNGEPNQAAAVLVSGPGLVAALVALFETVWAKAWDLTDPPPPDGLVVDDRDRRIISALRLGATDEAIARRVGVTPRTVGRRIARLHHLTGTRTRFQLGWRLAELTATDGA